MPRTARKAPDDTGEIKPKDFARAVKLYRQDIKSAASEAATQNQSIGEAYKVIKKGCHIQPQAAKAAFKLDGMEEAKRDDFLRCFTGLLRELGIPLEPVDLVDSMEGRDDRYARPTLVTVPAGTPSDGTETDLADAGEFTEMTEAELATQRDRVEPAPGSGAAARAKMKATDDETSAPAGQEG